MSAYPQKVWRLFRQPRRAGFFDDMDDVVSGRATTPAGHACLQLQLKISADGRIDEALFQALGCPYLIASGAWMCAHLIGRLQDSVRDMKVSTITEQLELPAVKRYCAVMAIEALQEALAQRAQEGKTAEASAQENQS